jgi:hypothetical protein
MECAVVQAFKAEGWATKLLGQARHWEQAEQFLLDYERVARDLRIIRFLAMEVGRPRAVKVTR